MDIIVNVLFILLNFSIVFGSIVPLPALDPKPCNLQIWVSNGESEVSIQRISVLEGDDVRLECSAMCSSEHYTPVLRWIDPDDKIVWDLPGRIFTASMSSHRRQKLRITDISRGDKGTYKCVGWIGYWTEISVNIDIGLYVPYGIDPWCLLHQSYRFVCFVASVTGRTYSLTWNTLSVGFRILYRRRRRHFKGQRK